MPAPAAVKIALMVVTDKKLLQVACGIVIGIILLIVAPIAVLLGMGEAGERIDWNSPEIQQGIMQDLTDEQREQVQRLESNMQLIEDKIIAHDIDVDPIKAQVIFLFTISNKDLIETQIKDFVLIFYYAQEIDEIFDGIYFEFEVELSADEREGILQVVERALGTQYVPPNSIHDEIARLLASDDTPVRSEYFTSPFRGIEWRNVISSNFGMRRCPFAGEREQHSWIDFAVPEGTPIYPVKPGTVLMVRYHPNGYGRFVVVNHGGGIASLYAHCSEILVAEGDEVTTDTVIALVGSTGQSTGPHLHFEIIINGRPVNPQRLLR